MSEFDSELYLRLFGERTLADGSDGRRPGASPFGSVAQALVAVGAIDEQLAEGVLDEYHLADALRSPSDHPSQVRLRRRHRYPSGTPTPLGPRRVVVCNRQVQISTGPVDVRYVSFTDEATRVAVTFSMGAQAGPRLGRRLGPAMPPAGRPPQPTLVDDRGASVGSHFAGGGSGGTWHGHFQATQPLARDTAWIELDGERIELVDVVSPADVSVERLPEQDPAVRHLWRLVTTERQHMTSAQSTEAAIDTLVACGALDPGDPAIGETQAAREAIGHGPMGSGPGAPQLPDPWHSLLARRALADGPTGRLTVSAVTPPIDGVSVAVTTLESTPDGWMIAAEVTPDVVSHMPFAQAARHRGLAWWARDDRGNHYLGENGSWSGGGDLGSGDIAFWPTLDPQATELVVMPTAETERAVIRLPLVWDAASGQVG